MIINMDVLALDRFYIKAKEQYDECIANKENFFLQDELSIPVELVEIKKSKVSVVFTQMDTEYYLLEISLDLWNNAKLIGKYLYVEDNTGNVMDDGLVFY